MIGANEISDRTELRALVDAYASAVDTRDTARFLSLFVPDARLTIHQPGATTPVTFTGHDELPGALEPLSAYRATMHLMANHTCELAADSARGETYCLAHHLRPSGDGWEDLVMVIRYGDRYVRPEDKWRFAARDVRIEWTELRPASVEPLSF
ncbi:MAG TPA: nuclear transport factor 2 family protein [Solirubrobacteraceae bacterium]|jgi:hypothetical protein|nr:nuclear transport factor 2 family protein [Solirubrobacteraceae bacterium]